MKKLSLVLALVFMLCFTFSCQDKEAMAQLEQFKAQAALEEQNKDIVKRAWELYDKGDFEAYKELLAPDFVYYTPSDTTKPESREEVIKNAKIIFNAFPDDSWTIEELIVAGDRVVTRWTYKGTQKGEYMGIPPTGNEVELSGILISRIENGKIVEDREEYDTLGAMQQLGMELRPKKGKK